jgi:hypothetical protein
MHIHSFLIQCQSCTKYKILQQQKNPNLECCHEIMKTPKTKLLEGDLNPNPRKVLPIGAQA